MGLELETGANLVEYHEIQSNYGHDGFLTEVTKFENYIKDVLDR